jgi:hypothetical protein
VQYGSTSADGLKSYGHEVSDIDGVAAELSLKTLIGLENLAFRHEMRREAILREVERRREERQGRVQGSGRARPKATSDLFDLRPPVSSPSLITKSSP